MSACDVEAVPADGVLRRIVPRASLAGMPNGVWCPLNKGYIGNATLTGGGSFGPQYLFEHNQATTYETSFPKYTEFIEVAIKEPVRHPLPVAASDAFCSRAPNGNRDGNQSRVVLMSRCTLWRYKLAVLAAWDMWPLSELVTRMASGVPYTMAVLSWMLGRSTHNTLSKPRSLTHGYDLHALMTALSDVHTRCLEA